MSIQKAVVIVKSEGIEKGISQQVVQELSGLGMHIISNKFYDFFENPGMAQKFYADIADKPYFRSPVLAIQRRPVFVMLAEGVNAVEIIRNWLGPTDINEAMKTDTFRGRTLREYGILENGFFGKAVNFVHASSSVESGEREARLLFPEYFS